MKIDEIKSILNEIRNNPKILDADLGVHDETIRAIIHAEKTYSFGLEHTTDTARRSEIEKIVLKGLETYKNEDKTD